MTRALRLVFATALLLTALVGPAHAQYGGGSAGVAVSSTSLVPGQPLTVTGDGWLPGSTVTLVFLSEPVGLGSVTVAADGTFSTVVTVPDVEPGAHQIRLSGTGADGRPRTVFADVTLASGSGGGSGSSGGGGSGSGSSGSGSSGGGSGSGSSPSSSSQNLAVTGLGVTNAMVLGAVLLVAGGAALIITRSRRLGQGER